jgi:hypothetical protein
MIFKRALTTAGIKTFKVQSMTLLITFSAEVAMPKYVLVIKLKMKSIILENSSFNPSTTRKKSSHSIIPVNKNWRAQLSGL